MAAKPPTTRPEDARITEIPNLIRDPTSCRYLPISIIGTGGFASVWRSKVAPSRSSTLNNHKDAPTSSSRTEPTECALKVVRTQIKSSQLRTRFQFELAIHNKLRHPHIVAFHRAFTFNDLTYIALELCENGSLTDVVKRRKFLTMPEIRRYMIQIAGAVEHLHSRDVVHRDIKAGNVFLDAQMNVKLGDFGLATCLEPSATEANLFHRRTTFCGTPNYLAPELLSRKGHARGVDIWALGILVYYLAVGAAPFHSKAKEEIYKRVVNKDYGWPALTADANEIPQDLKDLVGSILVEEEHRPSPAEIVRHSFFCRGFIPERIDSLARTRRPRWSRGAGASASTSFNTSAASASSAVEASTTATPSTYDRLLVAAFTLATPRHEPVLLSVQRELEAGIALRVPLQADILYDAFAPLPAVVVPSSATLPKRKRTRKPAVRLEEDGGIGCDAEGAGRGDGREVEAGAAKGRMSPARVRRVAGGDAGATVRNTNEQVQASIPALPPPVRAAHDHSQPQPHLETLPPTRQRKLAPPPAPSIHPTNAPTTSKPHPSEPKPQPHPRQHPCQPPHPEPKSTTLQRTHSTRPTLQSTTAHPSSAGSCSAVSSSTSVTKAVAPTLAPVTAPLPAPQRASKSASIRALQPSSGNAVRAAIARLDGASGKTAASAAATVSGATDAVSMRMGERPVRRRVVLEGLEGEKDGRGRGGNGMSRRLRSARRVQGVDDADGRGV